MSRSIGDKIKHLLFLRNLKQADLVKSTGISKATISELINNKQKNTSIETIERLAKALKVSPMYFLEEDAYTPFEVIEHLPDFIQKFIMDSENMDYIMLAHKIKSKELSADAVEKIIASYESIFDHKT